MTMHTSVQIDLNHTPLTPIENFMTLDSELIMTSEMKSFVEAMIPKGRVDITNKDVLCGRGSIVHKHMGNRSYRRIINENAEEYQALDKNSFKYYLALSIVVAIERQGGRFLKRDGNFMGYISNESGVWIELSRKEAVAKTAQALRDHIQGQRARVTSTKRAIDQGHHKGSLKGKSHTDANEDFKANQSKGDFSGSNDCDASTCSAEQSNTSHKAELQDEKETPHSSSRKGTAPSKTKSGIFYVLHMDHTSSADTNLCNPISSSQTCQTQGQQEPNPPDIDTHNFSHPIPEPCPPPESIPETNGQGIWVPKELESLMLSEPGAVTAIASL